MPVFGPLDALEATVRERDLEVVVLCIREMDPTVEASVCAAATRAGCAVVRFRLELEPVEVAAAAPRATAADAAASSAASGRSEPSTPDRKEPKA